MSEVASEGQVPKAAPAVTAVNEEREFDSPTRVHESYIFRTQPRARLEA